VHKSNRGVGTVFKMHDGAKTKANQKFHCPNSKGRENVVVTLSSSYHFEWEKIESWYFLELDIK